MEEGAAQVALLWMVPRRTADCRKLPATDIITAALDRDLNDRKYSPGLGDFGDRL